MRLYRKGDLNKIPDYVEKAYRLRNLRKKYGVEFFKDIKTVHSKHFYGLAQVAEKHGVTREYIRQVHKMIYGEGFRVYREAKTEERKESENLVCANDPRHKVANYLKGSDPHKGAVAEKMFMEKCEKIGLPVDISCLRTSDIIVNGHRIDVKSAYTSIKPSPTQKNKYFKFGISPEQRRICDFFACYAVSKDCFYIIPNYEKNKKFSKDRTIYISEEKTDYCNSKNKYHEYKNLFSQLFTPNTTTDAAAVKRQPETADV